MKETFLQAIRNKKRVFIDGNAYWVNELTVGDIFNAYHVVEDITNENSFKELFSKLVIDAFLIEVVTNCPLSVFYQTSPTELKVVYESFLAVNKQLLRKSSVDSTQANIPFIIGLFDLYCYLVEAGHSNVLNYGYSYFVKAINNCGKNKNRNMVELASAFRTARFANDKEWMKYIRKMTKV